MFRVSTPQTPPPPHAGSFQIVERVGFCPSPCGIASDTLTMIGEEGNTMSRTEIDTMMWHIQRDDMQRHGCDAAERDMQPLWWYINTGRASTEFLHKLMHTSPCMVARDLHKGGSYEEVINRVCRRIKYNREGVLLR